LLESLHAREHFAVDLDPRSIRVHRWSPDSHSPHAGHVVLSGCEGFSIAGPPGSRHRFHTKTILEDYCCPRLIDPVTLKFDVGRVAGFEREQDMWSFALIAFRMLNHGLRPWDARTKSHVRNPPDGKFARIVALNRNYAYGRNPNPDFEALASSRQMWFDPRLLDLFERTFRSARPQPTLDEWINVLRRLLHSSHRCEANTDHWKLGAACGECAVRTRSA
jgi:DNA-binding helix-hairpin-helix protein with protein kinase domain